MAGRYILILMTLGITEEGSRGLGIELNPRMLKHIVTECKDGELYIVNSSGDETKRYSIILGILEAIDVLSFSMIGGANSQLYIYINQIRPLQNIINNPGRYKNKLLDMVSERHLISVKMLTYIFEGDYNSAKIWDILEDFYHFR